MLMLMLMLIPTGGETSNLPDLRYMYLRYFRHMYGYDMLLQTCNEKNTAYGVLSSLLVTE